MTEEETPQLLKQIAESDDSKAFSVFFEQYHSKLLRIAHMFVSSPQMAEDIVSDVLVKLLKNRKETFNKENFMGYLYQCIKNQSLDHIKKNRKEPLLDINYNDADYFIIESSNPCSQLVYKEFEQLISDCIETMPPKRKLVFRLVKDDGLSYKEVANLLDISDRTVEVHLRIAIAYLKSVIEKYLDQNGSKSSSYLKMVRALATLILSVSTFEQAGIIDITQL
jgi:RNA polymerase sigma-70 factor (ECF subfamily)